MWWGSHGRPVAHLGAETDEGWKPEGFSPCNTGKAGLAWTCRLGLLFGHQPVPERTVALRDSPKVTDNLGWGSPRCDARGDP